MIMSIKTVGSLVECRMADSSGSFSCSCFNLLDDINKRKRRSTYNKSKKCAKYVMAGAARFVMKIIWVAISPVKNAIVRIVVGTV